MTPNSKTAYPLRSAFIQFLCPAPKRHLQSLILKMGLNSGLDIGCGEGSLLNSLRSAKFRTTGIDVDARSIERAKASNQHDAYILGDFMDVSFEKTFDVVVLSHVIEHFDRDTGCRVLRRLEELSRHLVYVETPNGFMEQTDYDGNPFQRHLSGWFPHDFAGRGYTVFGSGSLWLRRPMGSPRPLPKSLCRNLPRLLQWFYFRRPHLAGTLAAIRLKDAAGNVRAL